METLGGSFRDPSGAVFEDNGILKRRVNESYRADFEHLISSGLYEALTDDGSLVPHQDLGVEEADGRGAFKVLLPERIPFISYPYEWCFSAWRDAALLTLHVQSVAMDHGMSLKDASAYNVQFRHGRPILIDTLSFERLREGQPWVAYAQFCRHFLGPLALMATVDVRLGKLARVFLDGIHLDLVSEMLPSRTHLKPGLKIHVHAHAKSQQRHAAAGVSREGARGRFTLKAFRGLIDSLRGSIAGLGWEPSGTEWADYYEEADHYSSEAMAAKKAIVARLIDHVGPRSVWDLGANTGLFSRLASERGIDVVAFDVDPAAVERNYRQVRSREERNLLPLVQDLTDPSAAIGWNNSERYSLAERGPTDLVLALALVHHLAIGNNVPLPMFAAGMARLGRHAVIEWVPKTDPKVQMLLASREDVFPTYHRDGFEEALGAHFEILSRDPIGGTERQIYLLRSRSGD